jgi:hypothetical protein
VLLLPLLCRCAAAAAAENNCWLQKKTQKASAKKV